MPNDYDLKDDLNFIPQKFNVYNNLLPYGNHIKDEILVQLCEIKENLSKAVVLREIRPGCLHWVGKLSRYVKFYGLCFSKEDHILFVKLLYELVVIPNQEYWVTSKFCQMLTILLKKRKLLSPDDIELQWQPLNDIYTKLFDSSYRHMGMILLPQNSEYVLKLCIRACRSYFPRNATEELLTEWMPHFCPYDNVMLKAVSNLELFLPTLFKDNDEDQYWKLWLNEFMTYFLTFYNDPQWEGPMFCLFSRLAWQNIGRIDWEAYLPKLFTRFLYQFDLPVRYKKIAVASRKSLEMWAISMFIVSNLGGESKTQTFLNRLFKTLESYYHPSNTGGWTKVLQDFILKLSHYFVQRIHRERYKKDTWEPSVPSDKLLTEEDITRFVLCLQPAAMLLIYSKAGSLCAGAVLHRLSLLRPQIVIPPLVEQLYTSLETVIEPHRFTASLQCVVKVCRPLITGGLRDGVKMYPEGPAHVLPLLMMVLPGIDPNDITKCMVTLQYIATFVSLIPVVDCSAALDVRDDLTEQEQKICLQSHGFSDFVLEFMTRCFNLIESSSLEQAIHIDTEEVKTNLEENILEIGLSSAFKSILCQAHPDIFDSALDRLLHFTKGRCIETKVGGKFIATMCRSAAKVNPEKTLAAFLPSVCRLILALTESLDVQQMDNIDDELIFNILILSELVQCKGEALVPYIPKICEVLHRTIHLKSVKGYQMSSSVLKNCLWSLNLTLSQEYRSSVTKWDVPLDEVLPIRLWGEVGQLKNLELKWFEPGEQEEKAISQLIDTFLIPELLKMREVIEGKDVERERIHQCLVITSDIIYAGGALPMWKEGRLELFPTIVNIDCSPYLIHTKDLNVELNHPSFPANVRLAIANTTMDLLDALLQRESDDTKSLNGCGLILNLVIFFNGVKRHEFDSRMRMFQRVKQAFEDGVIKNKQHVRTLLIERTLLQFEHRLLESFSRKYTETHRRILLSLFRLSTSHYSEVRKRAQVQLGKMFVHFSYSYREILPQLVEILGKDPAQHHKEIKGALYTIHGCKQRSLIVRREWSTLLTLWPALLTAPHSEKPSVINLYEALLKMLGGYFEYFAIKNEVSIPCMDAAEKLLSSCTRTMVCTALIDKESQNNAQVKFDKRNVEQMTNYEALLDGIVDVVNSHQLHWRRLQMALNMLGLLIRPDHPFPANAVKVVLDGLISDNIIIRKMSIFYVPSILKNQKREHKKIPFKNSPISTVENSTVRDSDVEKTINRWLQYDESSINMSETEWNERTFVHKNWHGWHLLRNNELLYAPPGQQPRLDRQYEELSPGEKVIYEYFTSSKFVEKIIEYFSLEENKGSDRFDNRKFYLFKGLFRNFGTTFMDMLIPHVERLSADPHESNQRCASEIIAGMSRGSKHWKYVDAQKMVVFTCKMVKIALSKVLNETLRDWGTCLMNIARDRDPNSLSSLIELLLDEPVRHEEGSFLVSRRLYLTQMFLEQFEWRMPDCYERIFLVLKAELGNPYKCVRDRVGVFLFRIFLLDHSHKSSVVSSSNICIHDLVAHILPQLNAISLEHNGGASCTLNSTNSIQESAMPLPQSLTIEDGSSTSLCPPSSEIIVLGSNKIMGKLNSIQNNIPPLALNSVSSVMQGKASALDYILPPQPSSPTTGFPPNIESEERKHALRLMNTLCKFIGNFVRAHPGPIVKDIYSFLPYLCQLETLDSDQELQNNCIIALACIALVPLLTSDLVSVIQAIGNICQTGWWRARIGALSFLQVVVFHNQFALFEENMLSDVMKIVKEGLLDAQPEVRQMACEVLSGMFHCNLSKMDKKLMKYFNTQLQSGCKLKRSMLTPAHIAERHSGALGLCAYVRAHPYEIPHYLPDIITELCEHINDRQPVSTAIKDTLSNFRRTHHDNWTEHKSKFTADQLLMITDILVSPSYYV